MRNTLVFIGGWSRDESSYTKLIKTKPIDLDFHFISPKAIDLQDIGRSLNYFLMQNKIEKADFVGHSVGGAIAMEFAASYPDKIRRLYLIDSEGVPGSEKFQQLFVNFAKTQIKHGHHKITENAKSVLQLFKSPVTSLRFAKHAHYSDLRDKLEKIEVPTLILWGEKDTLTPLWQGEIIKSGIKNSKLVILRNMEHDWPLHSPQLFWKNYIDLNEELFFI